MGFRDSLETVQGDVRDSNRPPLTERNDSQKTDSDKCVGRETGEDLIRFTDNLSLTSKNIKISIIVVNIKISIFRFPLMKNNKKQCCTSKTLI